MGERQTTDITRVMRDGTLNLWRLTLPCWRWAMVLLAACVLASERAAFGQTAQGAKPEIVGPPLELPIRVPMAEGSGPSVSGEGGKPVFAGRVVAKFDFEEGETNAEEVPRFWFRYQHAPPGRVRTGFPPWNRAAFDRSEKFEGQTSVKLPVAGGSTSLRLTGGYLQIFPDAEYRVTAQVMTRGLEHSRAYVKATVLDQQQQPVRDGVILSGPIVSEGVWTPVTLMIRGPYPTARSIALELLVLQPGEVRQEVHQAQRAGEEAMEKPREQGARTEAGAQSGDGHDALASLRVNRMDYSGAAFFDAVTVMQLPRVQLRTTRSTNVFVGNERPVIVADVRDLTGEELEAEITVRDVEGRVVAVEPVILGKSGQRSAMVRPALPGFGHYTVTLRLRGNSELAGAVGDLAKTSVLWAGPAVAMRERGPVNIGWGLNQREMPGESLVAMAEAFGVAGVQRVMYSPNLRRPTNQYGEQFTAGASKMAELGLGLRLGLEEIPESLADTLRVDASKPWLLANTDAEVWQSGLSSVLGQGALRVEGWRMEVGVPTTAAEGRSMLEMYSKFNRQLGKVAPGSKLVMSWPAYVEHPAANLPEWKGTVQAVELSYPTGFAGTSARTVLANLRPMADSGVDVTLKMESLGEGFGLVDEMNHAITQSLLAWASLQGAAGGQSGADPRSANDLKNAQQANEQVMLRSGERPVHVALEGAVAAGPTGSRSVIPTPVLSAAMFLTQVSGGKRVVGEMMGEQGAIALVLAPEQASGPSVFEESEGALVAWNTSASGMGRISGYMGGRDLRVIDPFGNERLVRADDRSGRHEIAVTRTPVLVRGVDAHLVKFLADIRIEPGFVPALIGTHEGEVVLTNPWETRITGELTLLPPTGGNRREWTISPTIAMPFSIGPGQTARLPFNIVFSSAEEAGIKQLAMQVRVSADRSYSPMRIIKGVNVGLEDLDLQLQALLGPNDDGPNAVVTATVTNSGRLTRTLQLSAFAPSYSTQSQPVVDLAPGESVTRRFVYPGGAEALGGRRVRVLLVDVEGAERMSKHAVVPN